MGDLKELIQSNCNVYGHLRGRSRKVCRNKTRGGGIVIKEVWSRLVIHTLSHPFLRCNNTVNDGR